MKIKKRISVIGDDLTFFQSAKDFMANRSTNVSYAVSVKQTLNHLFVHVAGNSRHNDRIGQQAARRFFPALR